MPTPNQPTKPPTKTTSTMPRTSDDEPRIVTRGRVSHVEFAVDQPEPMSVQTPKPKKPTG